MFRINSYQRIISIFIGLVFITSSILKLLSLESVDLFFYEHKFFNWTLTTIGSRLLIAIEFILGLMLILKLYPRISLYFSQGFLVLFSVYIIFKSLLFKLAEKNCYCFGDIIELNDKETLIKNLVLIILSLFLIKEKNKGNKYSKPILIISSIIIIIGIFIIKPPDFISTKIYNHSVSVNNNAMNSLFETNELIPYDIKNGKKVICFYSVKCKYCVQASRKISVIIDRNNLNTNNFIEIFWGNPLDLNHFHRDNKLNINQVFVSPILLLEATNNRQPIIVLVENGIIIKVYKLTTINERYISKFLN